MELLLASTVVAALITTLVNLFISWRGVQAAKDLEHFRQNLASDLKGAELAYAKLDELRTWVRDHTLNAMTLQIAMDPDKSHEFGELVKLFPVRYLEIATRTERCYVYLRDDRRDRIEHASNEFRLALEAILGDEAEDPPALSVRNMIIRFAEYTTLIEKELDQALGQSNVIKKL